MTENNIWHSKEEKPQMCTELLLIKSAQRVYSLGYYEEPDFIDGNTHKDIDYVEEWVGLDDFLENYKHLQQQLQAKEEEIEELRKEKLLNFEEIKRLYGLAENKEYKPLKAKLQAKEEEIESLKVKVSERDREARQHNYNYDFCPTCGCEDIVDICEPTEHKICRECKQEFWNDVNYLQCISKSLRTKKSLQAKLQQAKEGLELADKALEEQRLFSNHIREKHPQAANHYTLWNKSGSAYILAKDKIKKTLEIINKEERE